MAQQHCFPAWAGRLLLFPGRSLMENPKKIFGPYVRQGMTVLEPGCAMGFFTLPLARMVGETGRVVALDVHDKMLVGLHSRAQKAGLAQRVEGRLVPAVGAGPVIEDLTGAVDFAPVINVAHEVPDQARFFQDMFRALVPGGVLLLREPKFHVSPEDFQATCTLAEQAGLVMDRAASNEGQCQAVFRKPAGAAS